MGNMTHGMPFDRLVSDRQPALDMDGTLLDLHFDDHFWLQFMPTHLPENHAFDDARMESNFYRPMQSTRGTLDWYCVDRWRERLEVPVMRHGPSSPSDPLAAGTTDLRLARKAGKQIVIATNAHRDVWQLKADTLDWPDSLMSWFPAMTTANPRKISISGIRFAIS